MKKINLADVIRTLGDIEGFVSESFITESHYWWESKGIFFPDMFKIVKREAAREAIVADAASGYKIVPSFRFEKFVDWYAQFFIDRIRKPGVLSDRDLIKQLALVEGRMKEVAPNDPTVYPLNEFKLGPKISRTNEHKEGALVKISAILPNGEELGVVAKKVPKALVDLFEQEVAVHTALISLGYRREVTEPIAVDGESRIITYGHFAGDLEALRTATDPVKEKYIERAVDMLLRMSLQLESSLRKNYGNGNMTLLRDIILSNEFTEEYLTQRFAENYILRKAATADGLDPQEEPHLLEDFYKVLIGEKKIGDVRNANDFPNLTAASTDPRSVRVIETYPSLGERIAGLQRFPGHDDFSVYNILAEEVGRREDGTVYFDGIKLNDVGLVRAPFQSFLYDILASANASQETWGNVIRTTHHRIDQGCEEWGLPFSQSIGEFRRGMQLVAVDKTLKHAALKLMRGRLKEYDS